MKILQLVGIILLTFIVVGFLLPNHYTATASYEIKHPQETVHAVVSHLETWPKWGPRSDEIFYLDPVSKQMMAASVRTEPGLVVGAPEALFPFESTSNAFAVAPDGEHFVFAQRGSQARPVNQLRVVFNWLDEVDRLVSDTAER